MRYAFEDVVLDVRRRELRRGGAVQRLEPQAFDVLEFLILHRDRVVSKDELFQAVWKGRVVAESNLTTRINAARAAIGDNGQSQRLIKTYLRKGIRFVGTVHEVPDGLLIDERRQEQRPSALTLSEHVLPSVAVLPFGAMNDGVADYFADGIVEDIILSLASLHELFVISRGTTLVFRQSAMPARAVADELHVRYVVAGSIRRSGESLRVWVELSDTESSELIWTNRIDCKLTDLFQVQDQIVEDIVARIAPNIRQAELKRSLRKPPESLSSYDYLLRALDLIYKLEHPSFELAGEFLQRSRERDPSFALAQAWGAWSHMYRVALGWSQNNRADIDQATQLAEAALRLDGQSAKALATFGHLSAYFHHDYDTAGYYLESALASCPNDPLCWALSSATSSYIGAAAEAIGKAQRAIRLSPLDKFRFYYTAVLCLAHYTSGQYDEAVKWGRLGLKENRAFTPNLRYLAAALAAAGKEDEAAEVARLLVRRQPSFTLKRYQASTVPFRDQGRREAHLEHLRRAGLPVG